MGVNRIAPEFVAQRHRRAFIRLDRRLRFAAVGLYFGKGEVVLGEQDVCTRHGGLRFSFGAAAFAKGKQLLDLLLDARLKGGNRFGRGHIIFSRSCGMRAAPAAALTGSNRQARRAGSDRQRSRETCATP